jgi:hypothetical protein
MSVDEQDLDLDQDEPQDSTDQEQEELTPEQENAKLKAEVAAANEKLNTFGAVIEELKARPAERIIERERREEPRQQWTREQEDERDANLAVKLATKPSEVLREVAEQSKRAARDEILGEFGDTAADTVIDRFVKDARKQDPIVADKTEELFRQAIDELGPSAKLNLLKVPSDQRRGLLQKEWEAAAGRYLLPKARAKVRPNTPTDTGGRTAAEMPERAPDGKFSFTPGQKAAMKRAGMDDKKIAAREKAIRESA